VLGAGVQVSATGSLGVAGLEWLGARAYDPSTRAFLSTDPLAPTLGAGWDGNPYAYAGNNPLAFSDPNGLKPLTDEELKAYDASARNVFQKVGDWVGDNWEYFAGGAMVIAGGVLIATGVGGPAGAMLVSAGADTIIQKATTGGVNWGQVALSGALGGFGGASIAAKAGLSGIKATMVAGASSGGIGGGIQGAYGYFTGPGPHTVSGALGATALGTVSGAVLGGAGGAAGHKIGDAIMSSVTRNAGADTVVMGRMMDQRVHPYGNSHGFATYEALPKPIYDFTNKYLPNAHDAIHLWANKKWINYQMMEGRQIVDIGAPDPALNPRGPGALPSSSYYDMEQAQVAGYSGYSTDPQGSWDLR
jgi:RHS repeat-associated protein